MSDLTLTKTRLRNGNAAMVYEGPWLENAIKANEQDLANYDFFLPPTSSGRRPSRPDSSHRQKADSASNGSA